MAAARGATNMTVAPAYPDNGPQTLTEAVQVVPDGLVVTEAATRAQRWLWRSRARWKGVQPLGRVVGCGRAAMAQVAFGMAQDGPHVVGTQTCCSVHSCPVCSPVIRQSRASDLSEAITRWEAEGGWVYFLTLTVPHTSAMSYVAARRRLSKVLQRWSSGRSRVDMDVELGGDGYLGMVRALDVTYSERNGWHPHYHIVLFVPAGVTQSKVRSACVERWIDACRNVMHQETNPDYRGPRNRADETSQDRQYRKNARRACDVRRVFGGEAGRTSLAMYAMKAGLELYRHDLKKAGQGSSPWELLERAMNGDQGAAERWAEYSKGSEGAHASQWSQKLRQWFFTDERKDRTDAERATGALKAWDLRAMANAKDYNRVRRIPGADARLLASIEAGTLFQVAYDLGLSLYEPEDAERLMAAQPVYGQPIGPGKASKGRAASALVQERYMRAGRAVEGPPGPGQIRSKLYGIVTVSSRSRNVDERREGELPDDPLSEGLALSR